MQRLFHYLVLGAWVLVVLVVASAAASTPPIVQASPSSGGQFVVNSSADTANPADGFLTLREAILVANGDLTGPFSDIAKNQLGARCVFTGTTNNWTIIGGCGAGVFDDITFDSAITAVNLVNTLPYLVDPLTTITGTAGVPRLDGSGISKGPAIVINGNTETIGGLSIINVPTGIAGNYYADIEVLGGTGNRIASNFLGVLPGSTACGTGGVTRYAGNGIAVDPNSSGSGADNGAVVYIFGNVIGCHANNGVYVQGADWVDIGQLDVKLPGRNYIGTTPAGNNIGNGSDGVFLQPFFAYGVRHNTVLNNFIMNNGGSGIVLTGTATSDNVIGGPSDAERNVISGNTRDGVDLEGSGTSTNTILGNYIGLNITGTAAMPNGGAGVHLGEGVADNRVGAIAITNTVQLISGNLGPGVLIRLAVGGNSVVQRNRIGVGVGDTPLGNGGDGVLVDRAFSSTITPDLVANNGGAGIVISGVTAVGDAAAPFSVYGNGGLAIDLGDDGHTPNDGDVDVGPNALLEYPVITASSGSIVTGTAPANGLVEYYVATGNPAAARGGGTFLGVVLSDGSGNWTVTLPGGRTRWDVTMLAYDQSTGNSSEFSPRPLIDLPLIIR